MSYPYHQEPSAPTMYPTDSIRPIPPVRSEFTYDPQEQTLLPPKPPIRMDKLPTHSHPDTRLRRVNIQIIIELFLNELII